MPRFSKQKESMFSMDSVPSVGISWHPYLNDLRRLDPSSNPVEKVKDAFKSLYLPLTFSKLKRGIKPRVAFKNKRFKHIDSLRFKSHSYTLGEIQKSIKGDGTTYYKISQSRKGILRVRKS
jgi:hypothetical protein